MNKNDEIQKELEEALKYADIDIHNLKDMELSLYHWSFDKKPKGKIGIALKKLREDGSKNEKYLPLYLAKRFSLEWSIKKDVYEDILRYNYELIDFFIRILSRDYTLKMDEIFDELDKFLGLCDFELNDLLYMATEKRNSKKDNYKKIFCKFLSDELDKNKVIYNDDIEDVIDNIICDFLQSNDMCTVLNVEESRFRRLFVKTFKEKIQMDDVLSDKFYERYPEFKGGFEDIDFRVDWQPGDTCFFPIHLIESGKVKETVEDVFYDFETEKDRQEDEERLKYCGKYQ